MKNRSARAAAIDFTVAQPLWNYVPDGFRQEGLPILKRGVRINVLFSGFNEFSREAFRYLTSCVQFLAPEGNNRFGYADTYGEKRGGLADCGGEKGEEFGKERKDRFVPFAIDYFAFCDEKTADAAEAEFEKGFYRYRDFLSDVGRNADGSAVSSKNAGESVGKSADEYLPVAPMPFSFSFIRGKNRGGVADKLENLSESGKPSLNIVFIGNEKLADDDEDERRVREAAEKISARLRDSSGSGDPSGSDDSGNLFGSGDSKNAEEKFRTVVFRLTDGRWKCVYDSFPESFGKKCVRSEISDGRGFAGGVFGFEKVEDECERVRRFAAYRNALYIKEKQKREGKFVPFEEILEKTLGEAGDALGDDRQSVCAFSGLVFYCAALGLAVVKDENQKICPKIVGSNGGIGKEAFAKFREIFALCEHYRWNACMITDGYVPAKKQEILRGIRTVGGKGVYTNGTDKETKKHGNLTTFSGLDLFADMISERDGVSAEKADVKAFDAQLIDDADELFAFSGLKIVRIPR